MPRAKVTKAAIEADLSNNDTTIRIALTSKIGAKADLNLSSEDTLSLIRRLMRLRAKMPDQQLKERPALEGDIAYFYDPIYKVLPNKLMPGGGVQINFYIQGFGWLMTVHPEQESKKLCKFLEQFCEPSVDEQHKSQVQ